MNKLAYEVLGPVFHGWMLSLHQHISYYDDGDTEFLFCARAGYRIKELYQAFLKARYDKECDAAVLSASRVSVCKGTFARAKAQSSALIAKEFEHTPILKVIEGMFRHQPHLIQGLDLSRDEYKAHGRVFAGWIDGPTPAAVAMRRYFSNCSEAFDGYLHTLLQSKKRAVLIDSGWQGSIQRLLASAYPEYIWKGLYFGRIPGGNSVSADDAIGLVFESASYNPASPATAIVRHRHIIESTLEPNGFSIEEIPFSGFFDVANELIKSNLEEIVSPETDSLYFLVRKYISDNAKRFSIAEITAKYQSALRKLERIIITPTREEALAFAGKDRSADFGRSMLVPVLNLSEHQTSDDRIRTALWPEGQIALEYTGQYATDLQLRAAGCLSAAAYFSEKKGAPIATDVNPSVAIITRTKNRPVLLRRAAKSVASQTYENYTWVIVNDGGDAEVVYNIARDSLVDRRKIVIVNNAKSLGMEAASNAGIRNSHSDLIVIHDDDDSWAPNFLAETVGFLASDEGARYGGVVTHSSYVSEKISGNDVVEIRRQPYMDWVRNIHLPEMAAENLFPPIAFVYRRSIFDLVGGYNEDLPVLGDWFFNMEFLLTADIGVLLKPLANYHHRDQGDTSSYSNSVIGGRSKHEEFAAVARNIFLRKHAVTNPLAMCVATGYTHIDLRARLSRAAPRVETKQKVESFDDRVDLYWCSTFVFQATAKKPSLFEALRFGKARSDQKFDVIDWETMIEAITRHEITIPTPSSFSEELYLEENPDVDEGVRRGRIPSGYMHYLYSGRVEGRRRTTITG